MKHKIWIGLFLAATIILGVGAANELFYQSRQTTKLQSCTLQFDANSKIQDDGATKTWDFAATAGNNTVLRVADLATGATIGVLTGTGAASFRTNVYVATLTVTNASSFANNVAILGTLDVAGAIGVTNITSTALTISGTASASRFLAGASPGIAATVDVLIHDSTTNRLVFIGGILVSNITTYAPPAE